MKNIIKQSNVYGLFMATVAVLATMKLNTVDDVSNEVDVGNLKENKPLIVACRKDDKNNYPDEHRVPLNDKGAYINVFSQQYINKVAAESCDITFKVEPDQAFGFAIISKKPEKKTPAKSEPPLDPPKK